MLLKNRISSFEKPTSSKTVSVSAPSSGAVLSTMLVSEIWTGVFNNFISTPRFVLSFWMFCLSFKKGLSRASCKSKIGAAGTIPPNFFNHSEVVFFDNSVSRISVTLSLFSCLTLKFINLGSLIKSSLSIFWQSIGQKL